jgi:dienelactone hydrolase
MALSAACGQRAAPRPYRPCRGLPILLAAAAALAGAHAAEPVQVQVPSLDAPGGAPLQQLGFWFDAGSGPSAAVVLLHGCGGPYGRISGLSERMVEYAERLQALGLSVLVTDSLTPRGERSLCTQQIGQRRVTQRHRRLDALGALQWLAAQPGVDATRLGLIGWSHGGSAVLGAINLRHAEVAAAPVKPAFAVAFYPGCTEERRRGYRPAAPLLLLLGAADDWTPAEPCLRLADEAAEPRPQTALYADAHHGFDGTAPMRLWREVPNGTHPGQGVHLGGHPAAREAARARLAQFLAEVGAVR